MNVFDWLSNMELPSQERFDIVEVRFKNGRKDFFRNENQLDLTTGDMLVVDTGGGHHIGELTLQGELVRLQMNKKKVKNDTAIKPIYRIATEKDLDKFRDSQNREMTTLYRTRQIITELQLEMKLSDIDLIELNEAFASQALAVIREAGLDPAKVNINGGAIALGHPLGCTGAKLTIQNLDDMKRLNKKYGMITACVGGGQGIAGIIENL